MNFIYMILTNLDHRLLRNLCGDIRSREHQTDPMQSHVLPVRHKHLGLARSYWSVARRSAQPHVLHWKHTDGTRIRSIYGQSLSFGKHIGLIHESARIRSHFKPWPILFFGANEMNGVSGHDSANEMICWMKHAPDAGLITRHIDLQPSMLRLPPLLVLLILLLH